MPYSIVFVDRESPAVADGEGKERAGSERSVREKSVGENIFLANIPTSPKVFAFFYPGSSDTREVEKLLRALGEKTGDNLFVNFGKLADQDYDRAAKRFKIGPLPVIVVTAIAPLAATSDGKTTYVRLDGNALFARPDDLVRAVEELFNLFLTEKIVQATVVGLAKQGQAAAAALGEQLWAVFKPVFAWAADRDIKIGVAEGTLELRKSGGHESGGV